MKLLGYIYIFNLHIYMCNFFRMRLHQFIFLPTVFKGGCFLSPCKCDIRILAKLCGGLLEYNLHIIPTYIYSYLTVSFAQHSFYFQYSELLKMLHIYMYIFYYFIRIHFYKWITGSKSEKYFKVLNTSNALQIGFTNLHFNQNYMGAHLTASPLILGFTIF